MKILLERDEVNPGKPDNEGRTPLLSAACNGHVAIVQILLERSKVGPGKPDSDCRTPLYVEFGSKGGLRFYAMERSRTKCWFAFAKVLYDSENLAEGAQIIRSSYVDLLGKEPQGSNNCTE